jgi:CubicO group peptidase (beta-lactamase class C family)
MGNYILGGLAVVVVGAFVLFLVFRNKIARFRMVATLFTGTEQHKNFNRVYNLFPSTEMPPSDTPLEFAEGAKIKLPSSFVFEGQTVDTETFINETDTSTLLVLKDGAIIFESYMLTGRRDVQWLSMSVAKNFVSALVGIALSEGHVDSLEDPVTKYTPTLAGSAYDGVRIKDVLQMSSGARWNEDYSDKNSDINRFGRIFATGGSMNEFAATLVREREPGTFNQYNSIDTQVLGMLVVNATRRTLSDYMIEKLWHPMGVESSGYWLLDSEGMELAYGGMNATARDYAKFGELYRLGGRLNGHQIIPAEWVSASVTPDAPHLQPGKDNSASDWEIGYGYQWWIPESVEGEYLAIGVYNQFIYVNPTHGVVIVKLSAFRNYGVTDDESDNREIETIELFRAIVNAIKP